MFNSLDNEAVAPSAGLSIRTEHLVSSSGRNTKMSEELTGFSSPTEELDSGYVTLAIRKGHVQIQNEPQGESVYLK